MDSLAAPRGEHRAPARLADVCPDDLPAAALAYAVATFPVVPLHTPDAEGRCSCRRDCGRDNGKHPRTAHGLVDASTDPERVRRWWGTWPDANIAVATGTASGVVVLDVDTNAGGWESLDALQDRYGHLPETPAVVTGGLGAHLYLRHPSCRIPNSAGRLGLGLDVRGDGGFVVAPPSRHRSGRRYAWDAEWRPDRLPFAEAPAWLVDLITAPKATAKQADPSRDGELIAEGARNTVLTSLGGTMRRRGFGEAAILAALLAENAERCVPPLDPAEVAKVARSVACYAPEPAPPGRARRRTSFVEFVGGRAVAR